eukprot:6188657-Pleurochrysis_carterae.AAC.3
MSRKCARHPTASCPSGEYQAKLFSNAYEGDYQVLRKKLNDVNYYAGGVHLATYGYGFITIQSFLFLYGYEHGHVAPMTIEVLRIAEIHAIITIFCALRFWDSIFFTKAKSQDDDSRRIMY